MSSPTPRVSRTSLVNLLALRLPCADVAPGPVDDTVTVEGVRGAYTVAVSGESTDFAQSLTVEVFLSRPPGFDEPLPAVDQMLLPHGVHTITAETGRRLRLDHVSLGQAAVRIISDFESASPTMSPQTTAG